MKNCVRIIACFCLIAVLLGTVAFAESMEYVVGGKNRAVATELLPCTLYYTGWDNSAWYCIDTVGYEVIYMYFPIVTNEHPYVITLYDEQGDELYSTDLLKTNDEAKYTFYIGGNDLIYVKVWFTHTIYENSARFVFCLWGKEKDTHCYLDMKEPTIIQEPTCTQDGYGGDRMCAFCGTFDEYIIPQIPHAPGMWVVEKMPTCTTAGETTLRCADCDIVMETEIIPATGHTPGGMNEIVPVTCTGDGYFEQRCTECNVLLSSESIDAFGHNPSEWITVKEETCEQNGKEVKKCTTCDASLEERIISALGHDYSEWEVIKKATKKEAGEEQRYCRHCGNIQSREIPKKNGVLFFS